MGNSKLEVRNITIVARHLICDSRKVCSQCSIYLWKPTKEKRHFQFCPQCKNDILCDRGIIQEFEYDEEKRPVRVIHRCVICRTEVSDKFWPEPKEADNLEMVSD